MMGKSNDNTISQLTILKQKINERGKILDATAAAVKDTLNMLQSLVSRFDSGGEGLLIRNCPTTIQDQELISVKENQPDMLIQVHESKHPRNHDNNYLGKLNNTAEDEIVEQKNTTAITNGDCRLLKEKFNRLLQEEISNKVETEEHKKKVKMKLQRQKHEVCLRNGEMDKAHKLFDEMPKTFLKHSFFKNCKDVEILVKNVWHKERFKENKIVSVHHHEDFEDKSEELDGICKPFTVKMYQGVGGDAGETMDGDGSFAGAGNDSGLKIKEVVPDASMYKLEAVEYKKKVKMKEIGSRLSQLELVTQQQNPHYLHALVEFQRQKLESFLRKEEMADARKLFEKMPRKNTFKKLVSLWTYWYRSSQDAKKCKERRRIQSVLEIILGGGVGTQLYPFSKKTTKLAVSLGANYRLIDIHISNCLNDSISKIYVLSHMMYAGNMGGYKNEGIIEVLVAQWSPEYPSWFQGTTDAVRQYLGLSEEHNVLEFLVLYGDHLYRKDYERFIQAHREIDKDIIIVALPMDEKWADGDIDCLRHDDKDARLVPSCVATLVEPKFCQVACGHNLTVALITSGHVHTMGSHVSDQLRDPKADEKLPTIVKRKLTKNFMEELVCGAYHVVILTSRTEVYTWRKGENCQLDHGDIADRNSPSLVGALNDIGSRWTKPWAVETILQFASQGICCLLHSCMACGMVFTEVAFNALMLLARPATACSVSIMSIG